MRYLLLIPLTIGINNPALSSLKKAIEEPTREKYSNKSNHNYLIAQECITRSDFRTRKECKELPFQCAPKSHQTPASWSKNNPRCQLESEKTGDDILFLPSNKIYEAWCGEIGKFEKSSERPTCNVQFKNQSIFINEFLEIPKTKVVKVKLNLVCTTEPSWDTCQTWGLGKGPTVIEKWGDKRYTFTYKSSTLNNLKAVITIRDWRTDKQFKKDLNQWLGWSKIEKGQIIRNTK